MKVASIGELLVDIIPRKAGVYEEGVLFEAHLGGAPFNYAVILSRLGGHVRGFGAVGNDAFGRMLIRTLEENNVDTSGIKIKNARTSLAFVILREDGERSFFFYRSPWANTADTMFATEDLDFDYLEKASVLYVSGMALAVPPLRDAVIEAMRFSYQHGSEVIFDFNVRLDVWKSKEDLIETYKNVFPYATILAISLDEGEILYNTENPKDIVHMLRKYEKKLWIKMGAKGAIVVDGNKAIYAEAFKVKAIDATGAGDAWAAALTYYHLLKGTSIKDSMIYANAMGALIVTSRGAIGRFVDEKTLEEFVQSQPKISVKEMDL